MCRCIWFAREQALTKRYIKYRKALINKLYNDFDMDSMSRILETDREDLWSKHCTIPCATTNFGVATKIIGRYSACRASRRNSAPAAVMACGKPRLCPAFFGVAIFLGSDFPAAFHGFQHGDFIGVFDVAADGHAHRDARDAQALTP